MFWAGMLLFGILAICPLISAMILNKRDGSSLSQRGPETTMSDSEI